MIKKKSRKFLLQKKKNRLRMQRLLTKKEKEEKVADEIDGLAESQKKAMIQVEEAVAKKGKKARTKALFRHCDTCKQDIPQVKFGKHQYWLAGVRVALCRGMPKLKRRYYEEASLKRMRKVQAQARTLGYDGRQKEAFIRGYEFGNTVQ